MDSTKPVLDLDAIEARANAATPGPWKRLPSLSIDYAVESEVSKGCGVPDLMIDLSGDSARADADFIAAARTDVPALVAEVRRLRVAIGVGREGIIERDETIARLASEAEEERHRASLAKDDAESAREEARLWKALAQAEKACRMAPFRSDHVSKHELLEARAAADKALRCGAGIDPDAP